MFFELLELAGNRALAFDNDTLMRLEKLHGRTLNLQITNLRQSVFISSRVEGLEFNQTQTEHVDVTLKASLDALFKISRDGLEEAELEPGELEIIGDPLVGQRFAQVIAQLDIDWEAMLTEQIGSGPAKTIGLAITSAQNFARQGRHRMHEIVIESLKNNDDLKHDLLVDKSDVADFLKNVDKLSNEVDKLEQRLSNLISRGEK